MSERPSWMAGWPTAVDWQSQSTLSADQPRVKLLSPNEKPRPPSRLGERPDGKGTAASEMQQQELPAERREVPSPAKEGAPRYSVGSVRSIANLKAGEGSASEARSSPGAVSKVSIAELMDTIMGSSGDEYDPETEESRSPPPQLPIMETAPPMHPTEPTHTFSPSMLAPAGLPDQSMSQSPSERSRSVSSANEFKSGDVAQLLSKLTANDSPEEPRSRPNGHGGERVPPSTINAVPTPNSHTPVHHRSELKANGGNGAADHVEVSDVLLQSRHDGASGIPRSHPGTFPIPPHPVAFHADRAQDEGALHISDLRTLKSPSPQGRPLEPNGNGGVDDHHRTFPRTGNGENHSNGERRGAGGHGATFDVGSGAVFADGLLEVFVLEASNLPTAEFTRAFAVLQVESHKGRSGEKGEDGGIPGLSRGVQHHKGGYDHVGNDGEVRLWDGGAERGMWTSWEELRRGNRGQAHKTEVASGESVEWNRGFRLKVSEQEEDCLRVQVLHMGKTTTEFIGEVVLDLQELVPVLSGEREAQGGQGEEGAGNGKGLSGSSNGLLLSSAMRRSRLGGEREAQWTEIPEAERKSLNLPRAAEETLMRASWFPLRGAAGGRVKSNGGRDSELRLGLRWREGVPRGLREVSGEVQQQTGGSAGLWERRALWLEPLEQILRFADGGRPVGRVSVRGARAEAKGGGGGQPHAFEVKTGSAALVFAADDEEEQARWIEAINRAGGVYQKPPKAPCLVRFRWLLLGALLLALLGALLGFGFVFFEDLPWHRGSKAVQLLWTLCPGGACATCDCYKRCVFARTLGGHFAGVALLHHRCAGDCQCALPPPTGACGDGHVRDVVADWYGVEVLFTEECDDGNAQAGDGCSDTCQLEEYMMTFRHQQRANLDLRAGTRTLCGSNHSFPDCEHACLGEAACACAWFGGGVCHLYRECGPATPTLENIELSYMEVEYGCGEEGRDGAPAYEFDPEFVDIRAKLILFGTAEPDAAEAAHFADQMRFELDGVGCTPCTTTITSVATGVLDEDADRRSLMQGPLLATEGSPTMTASRSRRDRSDSERHRWRRTGHEAGNGSTHEERDVVFVSFKVMVEEVNAESVLLDLVSFLDDGVLGFVGALRQPPLLFPQLRGLIVDPDGGDPAIHPRPAAPPDEGILYRKRDFKCVPDRYPPFRNHTPHGDVPQVCCGNISNVCSPLQRCYVSVANNYDCVVARVPYAPTGAVAVPWDMRADLYWDPPADDGGFAVEAFYIEKVQFVAHEHVNLSAGEEQELLQFDVATPRTVTADPFFVVHDLINFSPYYLRVSAINRIGRGPHSEPTPPFTPNVKEPDEPTNGMGEIGNAEVWLTWTASVYDGGRALYAYLLEVQTGSDLTWHPMPLSETLLTNAAPPSGQYAVTIDNPQQPSFRRAAPPLLPGPRGSRQLLQATTSALAVASTTPTPRNCSSECDPLATSFHVFGDQHGRPLRNAQEYRFRLFAANSYSPSAPSNVVALTPTGHVPHAPRNLSSTCHEEPPPGESYAPSECTSGFSDAERILVRWAVPDYDGGAPILSYAVRVSIDGGATFTDVHQEVVAEGDVGPWSHMIENLLNDIPHLVRIVPNNLYGDGTVTEMGPLTPRVCSHLVECGVCVEPNYDIWSGCAPPDCQGPVSTDKTRLVDCSTDGCRLEVLHDGEWGTIHYRETSVASTDIACYEVGLRPRPDPCGGAACGSMVQPAPTVGDASQIQWLQGLACQNCGGSIPGACCGTVFGDTCTTIHDCYAVPRFRWYPPYGQPGAAYGQDKWFQPTAEHAKDLGICCWPVAPSGGGGASGGGSATTAAAGGSGGTPAPGAGGGGQAQTTATGP